MQLTLRCRELELERQIRELASKERISLNQAALRLLRKGAGLDQRDETNDCIGSRLDYLAGTWSKREADELEAALEVFEVTDEEIWQ